jgi:hypothetical protein
MANFIHLNATVDTDLAEASLATVKVVIGDRVFCNPNVRRRTQLHP